MTDSRSIGQITTPEGRSSIDPSAYMTSNASQRRIPPGRKPGMTTQPFENAPQQPDTTKPEPECPPATTGPQTGAQGRNEWADGYAAARRYYGDTAPLALDKIRERIDQFRDEYPKLQHMPMLHNLFNDLTAILDTAQEPRR